MTLKLQRKLPLATIYAAARYAVSLYEPFARSLRLLSQARRVAFSGPVGLKRLALTAFQRLLLAS